MSFKRALRRVPQPYKTWVARALLPLFLLVVIAVECIKMWREVREW